VRIITLEEHFASRMQIEKTKHQPKSVFKDRSAHIGHDIEVELYDIGARRVAAMDAAGIDLQVLSLTQPACETFDVEIAIPMAREANDLMHQAISAYPGRFAAFAALPTPDPEAAVKEFERAITELGFCGAMINGPTKGVFLDDKKFWPLLECAESHNVPIYVHPAVPCEGYVQAYFRGYEELSRAAWGFAADASAHFLRIVFSGAFDRFPHLKIILGHMGEGLPFGMDRLGDHTGYVGKRRGLKRHPLEYFRDNLVITTAGAFSNAALLCSMLTLGPDNLLLSVDWPYESNKMGVAFLRAAPIGEHDREKIAHKNAERILKLQ
jgi:predicted TIM-barrel fold metal-dependent hydrolase